MPGGVIPNEGLTQGATLLWGSPVPVTEDFYCDLYVSNTTPVQGSVLADFTLATFTGYSRVSVPRSSLGSPVIVGAQAQVTSSVSPSFTCTGGATQTAYGFVLSGQTTGKLYFAQLFPTPRVMAPTATETLTPFTLSYDSIN